jgi:outer membrane protein OmpA-like peptidoglycan-associated protein
MSPRISLSLAQWALAVVPVLVLSGCATTESVAEKTAPLDERIANLDAKVDTGLQQAMAAALQAREQAAQSHALAQSLEARLAAQAAQADRINTRLDELEHHADTQRSQLTAMQQDIARQADLARHDLAQLKNDVQAQQQAQAEALDKRVDQQLEQAQARIVADANTHVDAGIQASTADLSKRMDQLEQRLNEVARMAEDALAAVGLGPHKIYGKVVRSITLTDDKTLFPINSPDLGKGDIAKLDVLSDFVKTLDVNYHISIHGYTDGFGSDDYNYELGKARAEVVKNYLHEKRGIPLLRMSVISHGALDVSSYHEGANRRIVVEVLQ